MKRLLTLALIVVVPMAVAARQFQLGGAVRPFIAVDAALLALTNARVIDGTGGPPREGQTIVIRDGKIAEVVAAGRVPEGARAIDVTGKTIVPGIVMVHEHLFYPTSPTSPIVYGQLGASFTRLYLAGGVTSMRTAGNMNGFMDINVKKLIEAGQQAGPWIDATGPYLNGPGAFLQVQPLKGPADARRQVAYWADMGSTSFKTYMHITRADLRAVIDEAHRRRLKVTGHLCSVTFGEAADLGIDNLEHGFLAATDFVENKVPDECPSQARSNRAIADLDENGAPFKTLVSKLVARKVAITSTLPVFETFVPGRPVPPGLEVLVPELRRQYEKTAAELPETSPYTALLPKEMALERAFVRAGGLLVAGTDPTGFGGVVPGYANHRQIELLVEAGFTPVEAIKIATLNGAIYLGRDATVGSIAAGKQADLVVLDGDPSRSIADIRKVETVFKRGVGFDPARLRASVTGQVGLW
jgi:imidazolonepropionase-like amidohydrolase